MASHSHMHTHSPDEKKALRSRLRKIAGQVAAIERMVEADRDCPEVLTQVVSVRKALKSFAQVVIHQHAHQCIEGASEPKEAQRKLRELLTVLERFVE
jgi:DNA-binding FrmR family transcriptional regulator